MNKNSAPGLFSSISNLENIEQKRPDLFIYLFVCAVPRVVPSFVVLVDQRMSTDLFKCQLFSGGNNALFTSTAPRTHSLAAKKTWLSLLTASLIRLWAPYHHVHAHESRRIRHAKSGRRHSLSQDQHGAWQQSVIWKGNSSCQRVFLLSVLLFVGFSLPLFCSVFKTNKIKASRAQTSQFIIVMKPCRK